MNSCVFVSVKWEVKYQWAIIYFTLPTFQEEELAGSPMLCLLSDNKTWMLVGISNWRIACSKSGTERPRLYDKITSNIEWIHKTMRAISWVKLRMMYVMNRLSNKQSQPFPKCDRSTKMLIIYFIAIYPSSDPLQTDCNCDFILLA